jgi:hypothetical protein
VRFKPFYLQHATGVLSCCGFGALQRSGCFETASSL